MTYEEMISDPDTESLNKEGQIISNSLARGQIERMQQEAFMQEDKKSMVETQLSLKEEIKMIENLLRSKVLTEDEEGNEVWRNPEDPKDILLSEFGINLILARCRYYLNKNTLLSNYEDDVILSKMEDFAESLNDEIFMKYERVFKFPTPQEVQTELINKINKRIESVAYNYELLEQEYDLDEIKDRIISELDLEKERIKLKEILMKEKLKSFEGLMRSIQDAVHSAYLRAWNGGERRSLRQTMSTTEMIGSPQQGRKSSGFFSFGKG